jgi:hypothetical protein
MTLGGQTFVNQGLVGTARLPADLHGFNGETLGSSSSMSIDLKTWRRGVDGYYTATMFTLPDRGPNNVRGFTTTNYAARLNKFSLAFSPSGEPPRFRQVAVRGRERTLETGRPVDRPNFPRA